MLHANRFHAHPIVGRLNLILAYYLNWLGTYSVAQAGLAPPECWDDKTASPHPAWNSSNINICDFPGRERKMSEPKAELTT